MFGDYDTQPVGVAREGVNLQLYSAGRPIKWSDSYQLFGMQDEHIIVFSNDRPVSAYEVSCYTTRCVICRKSDNTCSQHRDFAVFKHFIHCALEHDYTLPDNYVKIVPDDEPLQDAITKSHLYGFPMPGYDTHIRCLRQEIEGKSICVLHNLQGKWYLKG